MKKQTSFKNIPQTFKKEVEILSLNGFNSWELLLSITDKEIHQIIKGQIASFRNIKRLKCMATFICELKLELAESALLMQSGVGSINSLAALTPEQLLQRTGRLERSLGTGRLPIVDLRKAFYLINKAKVAKAKQSKIA